MGLYQTQGNDVVEAHAMAANVSGKYTVFAMLLYTATQ